MRKITILVASIILLFTLTSCSPKPELSLEIDRSVFGEENEDVNNYSELVSMSSAFYTKIKSLKKETLSEFQDKDKAIKNNKTILRSNPLDIDSLEEKNIHDDFIDNYYSEIFDYYETIDSLVKGYMSYIEGEIYKNRSPEFRIFINEDYVFAQVINEDSGRVNERITQYKVIEDRFIYESYFVHESTTFCIIEYVLFDSTKGYNKIYLDLSKTGARNSTQTIKFDFETNIMERAYIQLGDETYYSTDIRTWDFNEDSMIGFKVYENNLTTKLVDYYREGQTSFSYYSQEIEQKASIKHSILDLEGWTSLKEDGIYNTHNELVYSDLGLVNHLSIEIFYGLRTSEMIDMPLTKESFLHPTEDLTYIGEYSYSDFKSDLSKIDKYTKDYYNDSKFVFYGREFATEEEYIDFIKSFIPKEYTEA